MKTRYLPGLCLLLAACVTAARAQSVGIGTATPHPAAALDIRAPGKGLLIPRLDSAQRTAIASPPDGLLVFQTNFRRGLWYAFGGGWVYIPDAGRAAAAVPAENGLGKGAGGSIRLGGTLDAPTALAAGTNALAVSHLLVGAAAPDQSNSGTNDGVAQLVADQDQSFTAGVTGRLTKVSLWLSTNTPRTVPVLVFAGAGAGRGSTPLATASVAVAAGAGGVRYDVTLPTPPALVAGQAYTLVLRATPGVFWDFRTDDPYPGGQRGCCPTQDYRFATEMQALTPLAILTAAPSGLGVGTAAPAATLHVGGAASTVRLDGLAGPGTRLLTADATGTLGTTALPADATTATNGLSRSGNALGLGGALAGPTTVVLGGNPLRLPNAATLVPAVPIVPQGGGYFITTPAGDPAAGIQTFTATATGMLTQFEALTSLPNGGSLVITLRLYAGSGTGGPLLATGTATLASGGATDFRTLRFGPQVNVTSGQVYTARLTTPPGTLVPAYWGQNATDPYAGGATQCCATTDAVFRATISTGPGLALTPTGVGIGLDAPQQALHVGGTAGTPNVRLASLAGPGSRLVLADADGDLAAAASASPEALLGWQRGTATVGGSSSGGQKTVSINFPTAFGAAPGQVHCTLRSQTGQTFNDVFAVATRSVTATGFVVNVVRVEGSPTWGQPLLLDWLAMP